MTRFATVTRTKYNVLGHIPFIFFLVFISGFMWLFGDNIFPDWNYNGISYATLVSFNFFLLVAFLIFIRIRDLPILRTPLLVGARAFAIGFAATLMFFFVMHILGLFSNTALPVAMLLPMIILQVAIVAPAEELMFRGVVLSYVGIVGQAILFAAWHWGLTTVLQTGLTESVIFELLIFFIFGLVLGFVATKKELGIPACIGIHACWNIVVLGVIPLI